ncbi:MAG: tetratricopeptide repeat protein [Bryobacteraceae bacterium]
MILKLSTVLLLAIPLPAQKTDALAKRIENAPLPAEQRQAISAALAAKDFAHIEAILASPVQPGASKDAAPNLPATSAAELQALLGALDFVGGRMTQAVQAFARSESLTPLGDADRFTFAMALVNLGDVADARTELSKLDQAHHDQPAYLYWLARLDYNQRLYESAVEKLKRVVRLDPASVRGYDNLGLSYDMMGLTEEAQRAFATAVELNRKQPRPSPWPPDNQGHLLLRVQKFSEAEQSLRESLKYDPKFALAHYHLGRVLENLQRDDAAIEEYQSAAALDPKFPEPLYSLGLLYRRLGRATESESALAEYRKRKALSNSAL